MHKSNLDVITVIEPNSSIWPLTPKEFWQWREAFYRLTLKEYQVRFRDTYLGFIWVLLQPLLALLIFSVVLFRNTKLGPPDLPYSIYIFSGLIFWVLITNGFTQGSLSLVENRGLIIQTNLKRALLPLCILASKLMDLLIGLGLLIAWVLIDGRVSFQLTSFLFVFDVLGIFLSLIGITLAFSALCVEFKDIQYIVPFVAQVLFFSTPIVYFLAPSDNRWMLMINPFAVFILSIRDHFFGTEFVTRGQYIQGFFLAIVVFSFGCIVFRKFEKSFADMI